MQDNAYRIRLFTPEAETKRKKEKKKKETNERKKNEERTTSRLPKVNTEGHLI